jgi:hypothetical protein
MRQRGFSKAAEAESGIGSKPIPHQKSGLSRFFGFSSKNCHRSTGSPLG